jgi:hypothetical protein
MDHPISRHADRRMKQRGISWSFLTKILDNADVERPANDNCRLYRVTKDIARALGDDRLSKFAVIWSDDTGRVVTVVPIARGRAGARYRNRH